MDKNDSIETKSVDSGDSEDWESLEEQMFEGELVSTRHMFYHVWERVQV